MDRVIKYDENLYNRFKQRLEKSGWETGNENEFNECVPDSHTELELIPKAVLFRHDKPYLALFPLDSNLGKSNSFLMRKFLDSTTIYKRCIDAAKQIGAPYALIFTVRRGYIYDTANLDILHYAGSAAEIQKSILSELKREKVEEDSLSALDGKSGEEHGRELCQWVTLWANKLGVEADFSRREMEQFFHKILLIYQFELLGLGEKKLTLLCDPKNISREKEPFDFKELFSHYRHEHNIGLCEIGMRDAEQYKRLSQHKRLLKKFFSEFCLLSHRKFSYAAFMAAFGEEELRVLSWRLELTSRLDVVDDFRIDSSIVHSPIVIDLDDVGYSGIVSTIEKLFAKTELYNAELKSVLKNSHRVELQLDLLTQISDNVDKKTGLIKNVVGFVFDGGFTIRISDREHRAIVRLLIYSHLFELVARGDLGMIKRFPSLSGIFVTE